MKFYIGVTDDNWFDYLRNLQPDEVNFWRPGGGQAFRALDQNDLFLFKLHFPKNFIVGGGYFVKYSTLPVSLAWRAFAEKNGVEDERELLQRINAYRHKGKYFEYNPVIGCIILAEPFFWPQDLWLPVPRDWKRNIVQGKGYNTESGIGREVWEQVQANLVAHHRLGNRIADITDDRYGKPQIIQPRLGQGAFRVLVTDAYSRRCAISGERTLPVLEASHIKPYKRCGPHRISNGLLLRADLHILFDKGYLTVTPEKRVEISRRIKDEYENGRDYYRYHGESLFNVPQNYNEQPGRDFLQWHNEEVYKG